MLFLGQIWVVTATILTYMPPIIKGQHLCWSVIYGLTMLFTSNSSRISLIHHLNGSYLIAYWIAVSLRYEGIHLGYMEVFITFGLSLITYMAHQGTWFVRLLSPRPIPKFGILYGLLSVASLIVYDHIFPNTSPHLVSQIHCYKAYSWGCLACVGVSFALTNSFWEEVLYRGFYAEGVKTDGVKKQGILFWMLPSLVFAMIHYQFGFPRGVTGFIMTFIFALMMTHVRLKSGSVFPAIVIHAVCDGVIFIILMR
jgi:membrane protease YdiL (CAAX protease family)